MKTGGGTSLIDADIVFKKSEIGAKMKVADLGCGISGHFVFPAAELVGRGGIVYAVDILKPILETVAKRAKFEKLDNIRTVWSDLEMYGATDIEPSSLDVAMLINTLYQSKRRGDIIQESVRLIKKGGRLVVVEWKNIASPFGPSPEARVQAEGVKTACRKLGLLETEEFDAGPYHYGLIFIK